MADGPLYIKCKEGAHLSIGNNVFFNHNCSITVHRSITIGDGCNIPDFDSSYYTKRSLTI